MKSLPRLVLFTAFASVFCYLLWYRIAGPTDEAARAVRGNRAYVPPSDETLDHVMELLNAPGLRFAREPEADAYLAQRLRHYLKFGHYAELESIMGRIRREDLRLPNGSSLSGPFYSAVNSIQANGTAYLGYFQNWTNQYPESKTALIALANAHISHAWATRGSGWAASVDPPRWRLFKKRLNYGRSVLDLAEKLPGDDVQLPALRVNIAQADGAAAAEGMTALDEAARIDPHDMRAYAYMTTALLPRWGGQPGEWIEFARTIGTKYLGDDGAHIFARLVSYVAFNYAGEEVQFQDTHPTVKSIDWNELDRSFQAGTNRSPRSSWVWSPYAVLAFRAEAYEAGGHVATALGKQLAPSYVDNPWMTKAFQTYEKVRKSAPYIPRMATLYHPPAQAITDFEYTPDGKHFVTGDNGGRILLWNAETLTVEREIDSYESEVGALALSPDGRQIAAAFADINQKRLQYPPEIRLYSTETWTAEGSTKLHDYPYGLAYQGDSRRLVVSGGGEQSKAFVDTFSLPTFERQHFEWDFPTPIQNAAYLKSQNGTVGIVYGMLQLFTNSATPAYGFVVQNDKENPECTKLPIAFQASHDEKRIAIGRGPAWVTRNEPGWFAIWETGQWTNSTRIHGIASQGITAIAWSPDDKWLFTGGYDQAITVWDASEFKERAVLLGHRHAISQLRISPDGSKLHSAGWDGIMMLWDITALDRF